MDNLEIYKRRHLNKYNFYAATQQPGESFSQFATRLRELASKCNFADEEDELHYRFIMGMLPGPERSLLFKVEASHPLTFARAVEFVEGIRYTRGATTEWVTPLKTACEEPPEVPTPNEIWKLMVQILKDTSQNLDINFSIKMGTAETHRD